MPLGKTQKQRWGSDDNKHLCQLFDNGTIDPKRVTDLSYLDQFHPGDDLFKRHSLARFRANVKSKARLYLTDTAIVNGASEYLQGYGCWMTSFAS